MQFSEPPAGGGRSGGAAASAKREREARKRKKELDAAAMAVQAWWRRVLHKLRTTARLWAEYQTAFNDAFPDGDAAAALKLKPSRAPLPNGRALRHLATLLMRALRPPQRAPPPAEHHEKLMTMLRLVTLSTGKPEADASYAAEATANRPVWLATTCRLLRHAVHLFTVHLVGKSRVLFGVVLKFILDVTSLKNWAFLRAVPADARPKMVQALMQHIVPGLMEALRSARLFGVMRDFLKSSLHVPGDADNVLTAGLANMCVRVASVQLSAAADLTRDVLASTGCLARHLPKATLAQFTQDKKLWDAILTSVAHGAGQEYAHQQPPQPPHDAAACRTPRRNGNGNDDATSPQATPQQPPPPPPQASLSRGGSPTPAAQVVYAGGLSPPVPFGGGGGVSPRADPQQRQDHAADHPPGNERSVILAGNILQLGRLAVRPHRDLRARWSAAVAQLFERVPQRSEMTRLLDTNPSLAAQLRLLWEPDTITLLFHSLIEEGHANTGGGGSAPGTTPVEDVAATPAPPVPLPSSIFNHMRKSSRMLQKPDLTARTATITAVVAVAALCAETEEPEVEWAAPSWLGVCKLFNGLVYSWDTRSAINSLLSTPYVISALWQHVDHHTRVFQRFAEGTAPEGIAVDLGSVMLLLLHCFDNLLAVMDDKEFYMYQRPFTLATMSYMVGWISKLAFRLGWDGLHPNGKLCISCRLGQGGAGGLVSPTDARGMGVASSLETSAGLNTSSGSTATSGPGAGAGALVHDPAVDKLSPLQRQRGCVYARLLVLSQSVLQKLHQRETRLSFCPAGNWLIADYKHARGFHFPDVLKYLNDNIHNNPFENLFGVLRQLSSEMLQSSDPLERHFGDIFGNLRNLFTNLNEMYRMPDMEEPSTVTQDDHLIRYQRVIRPLPFLIPYTERLEYLRCLIERDRQAHHASDVKFPVTVRRNMALCEAVKEFARLDRSGPMHLKAQLHVKFLNKEGVPEDGIDEGGLFKELLEILIAKAFSPRLGYFTMSEEGRLYPNPRSRTEGGQLKAKHGGTAAAANNEPSQTPVAAGGGANAVEVLKEQQQAATTTTHDIGVGTSDDVVPVDDAGSGARGASAATNAATALPGPSPWVESSQAEEDERAEIAEAEAIRSEFDHLKVFKFLGRLLGKAIYEGVVVEVPFTEFFLNTMLGQLNFFSDIASLDKELFRHLDSLKDLDAQGMVDLGLNFTVYDAAVPNGELALFPKGESVMVTTGNLPLYLRLIANYKLNSCIAEQSQAFLSGFHEILPPSMLALFNRRELQQLISGLEGSFDILELRAHTRYEGYTDDHPVAENFWSVLADFTDDDKRDFLRFVMSSARPPLLGFGHINPPFMIRRITAPTDPTDNSPYARLPTSSTCFNLLCLPPYPSRANLKDRLLYAIKSGTGFELS